MKINPICDLLVGNRPENDSDTQYYECEDCHRYEICKKYGCVEMCSSEEIKVAIPIVLEPSYDLLTKEGYFEMSIIEQVKELKWYASYQDCEKVKSMMYQAADTIESLSTKLQAANMERSADCGGWIYCGDGKNFPEGENVKVIVSAVWDGYEYTTESYFYHGKFYNKPYHQIFAGEIFDSYTGDKVIAWQPLPEPYHEP